MSSDNRSTEESPVFPFNLCFAEHNLAQTSSFFSRSMRLKIVVVRASSLSFSNKEKKQKKYLLSVHIYCCAANSR